MTSWRERKRVVEVAGRRMAWVEEGEGASVLFLHGNPTSSFLWRDIMPHVSTMARALAPDLIGMGDSDKLPDSGPGAYRFVAHRAFLDGWIDAVVLEVRITLVLHDWGSALGFDWARRHPERVRGIAYMEAIVRPLAWNAEWPEDFKPIFAKLRDPAIGETLVLEKNVFVERILPASILRKLSEAEMAEYRRPFTEPGEGRRPTLTWPREMPSDVHAIVAAYWDWLRQSAVPKLLLSAEPGGILTGAPLADARTLPNSVQEDSAEAIGRAVAAWAAELP
jgi:haloalkane dehalogenase